MDTHVPVAGGLRYASGIGAEAIQAAHVATLQRRAAAEPGYSWWAKRSSCQGSAELW